MQLQANGAYRSGGAWNEHEMEILITPGRVMLNFPGCQVLRSLVSCAGGSEPPDQVSAVRWLSALPERPDMRRRLRREKHFVDLVITLMDKPPEAHQYKCENCIKQQNEKYDSDCIHDASSRALYGRMDFFPLNIPSLRPLQNRCLGIPVLFLVYRVESLHVDPVDTYILQCRLVMVDVYHNGISVLGIVFSVTAKLSIQHDKEISL